MQESNTESIAYAHRKTTSLVFCIDKNGRFGISLKYYAYCRLTLYIVKEATIFLKRCLPGESFFFWKNLCQTRGNAAVSEKTETPFNR